MANEQVALIQLLTDAAHSRGGSTWSQKYRLDSNIVQQILKSYIVSTYILNVCVFFNYYSISPALSMSDYNHITVS